MFYIHQFLLKIRNLQRVWHSKFLVLFFAVSKNFFHFTRKQQHCLFIDSQRATTEAVGHKLKESDFYLLLHKRFCEKFLVNQRFVSPPPDVCLSYTKSLINCLPNVALVKTMKAILKLSNYLTRPSCLLATFCNWQATCSRTESEFKPVE